MASLVLTDSSQLTVDSFKKLPDKITYPYAEPDDLQKHVFSSCQLETPTQTTHAGLNKNKKSTTSVS
uniref:Uncharacterized protein n=1 Tax=Timema shepardi TaxID=629360 RepID=A0A7R9BAR1_TIMSH|nr:unnamed protein product [Timema shepardi]